MFTTDFNKQLFDWLSKIKTLTSYIKFQKSVDKPRLHTYKTNSSLHLQKTQVPPLCPLKYNIN